MTYFLFIVKSALDDFRRNKIRTFLTSLGILIGVASVVLLMSFGLGFKKYIKNQFESLGTNLLVVFPGQVGFRPGGGALGGAEFNERDVLDLKKVKNAEYIVPTFIKTIKVSVRQKSEIGDLFASNSDIFIIRNLEPSEGRLFSKTDIDKRSRVVVIGPKIAEKLFGAAGNAVDKIIKIEKQSYKVVGVLKSKGGGFGGPDLDSFVYMPYKSAYTFNPNKKFIALYIKVDNENNIAKARSEVKERLLRHYNSDDFSVVEQTEILNTITSIFAVLNSVLVFIGAISLVVGGIGIMNIMYVSVIEKIKEIGIRRAIGATKLDILFQFLAEAIILSFFGGFLGLTISFLLTLLIQRVFPAYIDLPSVVIALGVSSGIGVIFGVFPAKKAADLSPIEAIRYE